ncbi:TRAM domain-containing protein [Desulfobacterota bacterium AH_259_B03_O07]|nr:TRAM domain-containing protein [Desulfobacterota bacterium AH_259_B03_O07]
MKLKILFFLLSIIVGFWITYPLYNITISAIVSVVVGALTIGVIFGIEYLIKDFPLKSILGLAVGLIAASLAFFAINEVLHALRIPPDVSIYISLMLFLLLFYLGISEGVRKGFKADRASRRTDARGGLSSPKILDTSAIIDGRIADVAEAGFIDGVLIVPKFIIKELQYIADSNEPIKRVRGRRGLDVLKRMQQDIPNVVIRITSHDFPKISEADLKLVELAKRIKAIIVTNDYNLNKVAGLQGVKVLNLNQLSSALKPVVLPGETLNILVVKEGKEENQGVGYLEDGTMIVVDDGKKYLGKDMDVSVTSVLQTPTGRMIFSRVVVQEKMVSEIKA